MHCHRLTQSLFHTSRALRKWNKESFGFAQVKIKSLDEGLDSLQKNDMDRGRQMHILKDLRIQWARLEFINR